MVWLHGWDGKMGEKSFLSWVGFKGEDANAAAPTENALERIRNLEAQLADLRSRRDITSLTKEEFEILSTETAMTIIKSAQAREAKAATLAQKVLGDSTKTAADNLAAAEAKARQILAGAEARGRKYLDAAEAEAVTVKTEAEREAEELISSKKREALSVTSAAKREAEKLVAEATGEIADYRNWLNSAISETERLYRIQTQSLQAAEQAITQSRTRLGGAFDKLNALQADIGANVDSTNRPQVKSFAHAAELSAEVKELDEQVSVPEVPFKKPAAKRNPKRSTSTRSTSNRSASSKSAKRTTAKRK